MKLHPTPSSTDCPICREKEALTYALDCTKYYVISALTPKKVEASYDAIEPGDDTRLFCNNCGEYFEVPEHVDLYGG